MIYSQSKKADSLTALLNSPVDSVKLKAHLGLCKIYLNSKPAVAREHALKAFPIAEKINYLRAFVDCYAVLSKASLFAGKYDSAYYFNDKSIAAAREMNSPKRVADMYQARAKIQGTEGKQAEAKTTFSTAIAMYLEQKDEAGLGDCYVELAQIASDEGNFDVSMRHFLNARKIFEKRGDKWSQLVCMNNMCNIFIFQKQYEKAVSNYRSIVAICRDLNKLDAEIIVTDNIGTVFLQQKMLDSSEVYFKKAYEMLKLDPDNKSKPLIVVHLATLAQYRNNMALAEKYYFEAIELYKQKNNDAGLNTIYSNLGHLYLEQKKYDKAEPYVLQSVEISHRMGLRPALINSYHDLGYIYFFTKKYDKAFNYFENTILLKDTLFSEKSNEAAAEMEAKYQNDKKEKEIAIKNTELSKKDLEVKQQNLQKLVFAGGAVALMVVGGVLLRGNRRKKKANELLHLQKSEILSQKAIIEEKNKDITDSIKYAKRIQEAILPSGEIVKSLLPEHFILYEPKDIVSGDFYWVQRQKKVVLFAVADCTGHGVPGALMSVVCSNALGRALHEKNLSRPSEILDYISLIINDTLRQHRTDSAIRDGMDIALCSYDAGNKTLEFSGANNPLYLLRNGELIITPGSKQPIGSFIEEHVKPFVNHTMQLQSGDMVFVFSDGYADQFGGTKGKKLKYARLQEMIKALKDLPMEEIKNNLGREFSEWKGKLEQVDDVCIIGVRV